MVNYQLYSKNYFSVQNKDYWSMFYKKTPTTIYFNVSLLIQCNACRFFVIICDIY